MLHGRKKSQLYVLQDSTESLMDQHSLRIQVDCEFGSILFEFCLGSTLMNTFNSSSKVMDNPTLPPLSAMPLYSIFRNKPIFNNMPSHIFKDTDLVNSALFVVEGDNSRKDPSVEVFLGNSVTWLVLALFGDY